MYLLLSVFAGMVIAVMIAINGQLTIFHGIFAAAVVIHIVGSIFAFAVMKMTRQNLRLSKKIPFWFYLGGALGVITTFSNNYAFGKISLTSIIALVLLGQTAASLMIDSFGLFGMRKYPFRKYKLIGLSLAVAGIAYLFDAPQLSDLLAVLVSFAAGISIVLSRTCNARLAEKIGLLPGSLVNHLVGLPFCIALFLVFDAGKITGTLEFSSSLWIYFGGALGVVTVLLFNLLVPKVPAFQLTILTFIGQVFTGILLDLVLLHTYDAATFYAGLLIAVGIGINIILDIRYGR